MGKRSGLLYFMTNTCIINSVLHYSVLHCRLLTLKWWLLSLTLACTLPWTWFRSASKIKCSIWSDFTANSHLCCSFSTHTHTHTHTHTFEIIKFANSSFLRKWWPFDSKVSCLLWHGFGSFKSEYLKTFFINHSLYN